MYNIIYIILYILYMYNIIYIYYIYYICIDLHIILVFPCFLERYSTIVSDGWLH